MCFKVHRAVFQGPSCVWSGEGLCWCVCGGRVVKFAISSDGFLNVIDIHKILAFRTPGDTWPAAFYLVFSLWQP